MVSSHPLTPQEREFFTLVNQAVFTNPFTRERSDLDRKIAGLDKKASDSECLEIALTRVVERIDAFEKTGRADVNRYTGNDRRLMETSLLFDFFHRFTGSFDRLIRDQAAAGGKPLKIDFAREAFQYLNRRGFNPSACRRYFELVYQLRRAYYFIDRGLVGVSPSMQELRRKLWNNVFTQDLDLYNRYLWNRMEDFSTLLLGETGTGKGTAAAAIGRSGFIPFDERKGCFAESFTESFISLNLSQFPENLMESELFGHKKGAFTGAVEDYQGIFDRCSRHGAIFLDEIGEVSPSVQIKLLQILQERTFTPVGSHRKHRFRGRIIAATNRPMDDLRGNKRMRDDFYYRLCSDIITVPPLRRRIRETLTELDALIALLVKRMLGDASAEITRWVRRAIHQEPGNNYDWPGNVRELEQCIRAILLNNRYTPPTAAAAPDFFERWVGKIKSGELSASQLMGGYCTLLHQRHKTYEAVARITNLDRRTVKKYIVDLNFTDKI